MRLLPAAKFGNCPSLIVDNADNTYVLEISRLSRVVPSRPQRVNKQV